jgi:DNA-binding response OmpR family regulator
VAIARLPDGLRYIRLLFARQVYFRFRFACEAGVVGLLLSYPLLDQNHLNSLPDRDVILITSARKQETVENIGVLIIEDDAASQAALRQVLGAEGWLVEGADSNSKAFQQLATGKWTLVLANIATTGMTGALFATLRELALPPEGEAAKARVRVLFLVPEAAADQATPLLEQEHLPYVVKPFTFHDLLERVSDLLMETQAIGAPLRRVRQEGLTSGRRSRRGGRDAGRDGSRNTGMFANRDDYQMTEEEITEYERQETDAQKKKKKKPITLG